MNYPALVQSLSGKRLYHITEDGQKTRCGHKCSSLVERHPINVSEMLDGKTLQPYPVDRHCPRCGELADFETINQARADEERQRSEEQQRIMAEIARIREARNAARPGLVESVLTIFEDPGEVVVKHHENMDEIVSLAVHDKQLFTVKVQIWNGDHR
jgi:rubredoxin